MSYTEQPLKCSRDSTKSFVEIFQILTSVYRATLIVLALDTDMYTGLSVLTTVQRVCIVYDNSKLAL